MASDGPTDRWPAPADSGLPPIVGFAISRGLHQALVRGSEVQDGLQAEEGIRLPGTASPNASCGRSWL